MQKRGQVSIEIMFSIGVILLLYITIVYFVFEKRSELQDTESFLDKRSECFKVAEAIIAVNDAGPGTRLILDLKYPIIINNNTIQVANIKNITASKIKIAYLSSGISAERASLTTALQKKDPGYDTYCTNISFVNYVRSIGGTYADAQLNGDYSGQGCPPYPPVFIGDVGLTLQELLDNLNKYNTIYIEDFHLLKENYNIVLPALEQWLQNNPNLLVFSEHITHYHDISGPFPLVTAIPKNNIFSITYNARGYNNGPQPQDIFTYPNPGPLYDSYVTHESGRYPNLLKDTKLHFVEYPYVNGSNIYIISEYYQGKPLNYGPATGEENVSIGYWKYGQGEINYISDFDETLFPNFPDEVVNYLETAHYLLNVNEQNSISCIGSISVDSKIPYFQKQVTIQNINNKIYLTNETL